MNQRAASKKKKEVGYKTASIEHLFSNLASNTGQVTLKHSIIKDVF